MEGVKQIFLQCFDFEFWRQQHCRRSSFDFFHFNELKTFKNLNKYIYNVISFKEELLISQIDVDIVYLAIIE